MDVLLEVMVDWNSTDWRVTPSFSGIDNITDDVVDISNARGKDDELGNAPSGTIDIELKNLSGKYMPPNTSSPLYGLMRPWLPVRIRTIADGITTSMYVGFISKIKIPDQRNSRRAHFYCTDGMDLLARNMVTQVNDDREPTSPGGAVGKVLDAAGWPLGKRSIDITSVDGVNYPRTVEY